MSMVLGFIFGNWHRVAILLAVLGAFALWGRFQLQEHDLKETRAALARESALRAAAENQLALNQHATHQRDITERVAQRSAASVYSAQQEIANAQDAHSMYVAWTDGIGRVRNDTGAASA